MASKEKIGWLRNTYADKIEFLPRGEEEMHIPESTCECEPIVWYEANGMQMIQHRSNDRRELFEQSELELPDSYRGRMAA